MYGLSGYCWLLLVIVKTDNTAYQALVLVWLGCGNTTDWQLIHTMIEDVFHLQYPCSAGKAIIPYLVDDTLSSLEKSCVTFVWSGLSCKLKRMKYGVESIKFKEGSKK